MKFKIIVHRGWRRAKEKTTCEIKRGTGNDEALRDGGFLDKGAMGGVIRKEKIVAYTGE